MRYYKLLTQNGYPSTSYTKGKIYPEDYMPDPSMQKSVRGFVELYPEEWEEYRFISKKLKREEVNQVSINGKRYNINDIYQISPLLKEKGEVSFTIQLYNSEEVEKVTIPILFNWQVESNELVIVHLKNRTPIHHSMPVSQTVLEMIVQMPEYLEEVKLVEEGLDKLRGLVEENRTRIPHFDF